MIYEEQSGPWSKLERMHNHSPAQRITGIIENIIIFSHSKFLPINCLGYSIAIYLGNGRSWLHPFDVN